MRDVQLRLSTRLKNSTQRIQKVMDCSIHHLRLIVCKLAGCLLAWDLHKLRLSTQGHLHRRLCFARKEVLMKESELRNLQCSYFKKLQERQLCEKEHMLGVLHRDEDKMLLLLSQVMSGEHSNYKEAVQKQEWADMNTVTIAGLGRMKNRFC